MTIVMRLLVILALASVTLAGSNLPVAARAIEAPLADQNSDYFFSLEADEQTEEGDLDLSDIFDSANTRGLIASWEARRQLRKLVAQMECGWPKYGIPPLAPFKVREAAIDFQKGFFETLTKIFFFRVDGLNKIEVNKLKVNILTKKIIYDIVFPEITINADKYETNTTLGALSELGVNVQYVGDGSCRFVLHNLRVVGKLKGKIPLLFGSAKPVSLKTEITLEKFTSDVSGFSGGFRTRNYFNKLIEQFVEFTINSYTQQISDFIEEWAKSEINSRLQGKDFWSLLNFWLTGNDDEGDPIVSNCVPPPDTWDK